MIYDRFENIGLYYDSIPYLKELNEELTTKDLSKLPVGTYYTKENSVKYMVQEYATATEKRPEVHGSYMDVQLMLDGNEKFGAFLKIDSLPKSFDDDNDIGFLDVDDRVDIPLKSGSFIIVFPYEPHTPGLVLTHSENVRKIVAKIPYRV